MKKISVIVPIYNAEKKLNLCIKSILNQSFKDFELILVNDGSTDNSLRMCKKFKYNDPRVVLIDGVNEGSIAARKKGVEKATSDYVMFVDADDWIENDTIATLYKEVIENSLDIVVCNTYKVLGKGRIIKQKNSSDFFREDKIFEEREIKKDLVTAYFHGHPFPASLYAKLYKKEFLLNSGKYLNRIEFLGDDLFFNLEIFLKASRVKIINKPLYYYRMGGLTSKYMSSLFEDMVNGYEIQKEVINKFYPYSKQEHENGISIMLLNTFKTCLYNLFNGKLKSFEKKKLIYHYCSNKNVIECLNNDGALRYFPQEYLNSIRNKNVNDLYSLGGKMYFKRIPKKILINIMSKVV
ncbi:glycosyltransferase family 2 protein [Rossellomorea aquimaris]|uniref:glycosyltransferase family 2 protein n=1 Tax=Rossellomorea aquimaris TaxID=189382 RepID=UPI0007D06248|nr:glycosyltransferase family 2 protein [Rossellomorea aquimaris]